MREALNAGLFHQEQHARPSEATGQAKKEEDCKSLRLPVQLALHTRPHGPERPARAQVGLRETQALTGHNVLEIVLRIFKKGPVIDDLFCVHL